MMKRLITSIVLIFLIPNLAFGAIAFNSSLNSSSASYSFTNTSGNFLVLCVGSNANTIFTATYNGISLTSQGNQKMDTQNNWIQILTLPSPSTGSNTLTITGSGYLQSSVSTYSGVGSGGQPEVVTAASKAGGTNSFTHAITTVDDNSWAIACYGANSIPISYTNVTARASNTFPYLGDTNGVVHPAGSISQTATVTGTTPFAIIQIALSPTGVSSIPSSITGLVFSTWW